MTVKVNLYDSLIGHSEPAYGFKTFSPFVKPKQIQYYNENQEVSVYTDKNLVRSNIINDKSKTKVAWLVECREVHPFAYEHILSCHDVLDYVFTFDDQLLSMGDKFIKTPIASSRIIDKHSKIYKKSKDVSFIISNKKWTSGHKLRHELASSLADDSKIDFWGSAYRSMPQGSKIIALAEYKYSIVVENSKDKNYFTEKLIDCFRVGTIPIYWGSNSIDEHFDMGGIMTFNNVHELDQILSNISTDDYSKRMKHIKNNYNASTRWTSMDDTFAINLQRILNNER